MNNNSSLSLNTKNWYVIHAHAGTEKVVQRILLEKIKLKGIQKKFGEILVPTEEVIEIRNGCKFVTERRFFPGYIFIEMEMTDETWHFVKNTIKVTGFVGGTKNKPSPIPNKEVEKIRMQIQEGIEKPRPKTFFEIGEILRVKDGPFTDFNGTVEEVNYEKSRIRVLVTIFGRPTPVELEFRQVEKI